MDSVQFAILQTLYENIEKIMKTNGWVESKIRKSSSLGKDETKVALLLLLDKKLISQEKVNIKLGRATITESKYRINQKGIDEYHTVNRPFSC